MTQVCPKYFVNIFLILILWYFLPNRSFYLYVYKSTKIKFPFQMVHQQSIAFIQHFVFAPPVRNTALSVYAWLSCGPLASSVYFGTNATVFLKFNF